MTRAGLETLTAAEATALAALLWHHGVDRVEQLLGVSHKVLSRARRLLPVSTEAVAKIRAVLPTLVIEPIPTRLSCPQCGKERRVGVCAARTAALCLHCTWRKELPRRAERKREQALSGVKPTPRPVTITATAWPCPACGTALRRDGQLLYCPRRCDDALTFVHRRYA